MAAPPGKSTGSGFVFCMVATVCGLLQNFDPAKFAVDATSCLNPFTGKFNVANVGNSMVVRYLAPASAAPPVFSGAQMLSNGHFQFTFSSTTRVPYSVRASTKAALNPITTWPILASNIFAPFRLSITTAKRPSTASGFT